MRRQPRDRRTPHLPLVPRTQVARRTIRLRRNVPLLLVAPLLRSGLRRRGRHLLPIRLRRPSDRHPPPVRLRRSSVRLPLGQPRRLSVRLPLRVLPRRHVRRRRQDRLRLRALRLPLVLLHLPVNRPRKKRNRAASRGECSALPATFGLVTEGRTWGSGADVGVRPTLTRDFPSGAGPIASAAFQE